MASTPRVVLVHGAATTAAVWDAVVPLLSAYDVEAPERPRTGDLDRELAWLIPRVEGAWVVGMSGGATLGLALAARGVPLAGAILHEPAVGSLVPDLLEPVATAFAVGGTNGFGCLLYGPAWRPSMAGDVSEATTAAEIAMFRSAEPGPARPPCGPVLVTYGARSRTARRCAAERLREVHRHRIRELPDVGHFLSAEHPRLIVGLVDELTSSHLGEGPASTP
jgi:pimeloyl-ACP methyl ester carboxylesterase